MLWGSSASLSCSSEWGAPVFALGDETPRCKERGKQGLAAGGRGVGGGKEGRWGGRAGPGTPDLLQIPLK